MSDWLNRCHFGDVRDVLRRMIADGVKVNTIVTSPPYWGLRDYGHSGQIGLEPTIHEFIATMVEVFDLARQVLADDGTAWVNMGDCYATGAGKVNTAPGGGTQGERWSGIRGDDKLPGVGPMTQPNRMPQPGLKPKDLVGQPWRLAFALQDAGWWLRQDIILAKPNPMPESVTDRCTKSHEYIFLLSKSERYFFDSEAMKEPAVGGLPGNKKLPKGVAEDAEKHRTRSGLLGYAERQRNARKQNSTNDSFVPGATAHGGIHREGSEREPETRNKRSVWTVPTRSYKGAHFATFPPDLITPCILSGAPAGGVVLDPFFGSGTTGQVAQALGRKFIGIELNLAYKQLQDERLRQPSLNLEAA